MILDEIKRVADALALEEGSKTGVKFGATVHAHTLEEALERKAYQPLFGNVDLISRRKFTRSSRWGAWLDSTLDRVGDAAVFGGIALWFSGGGDDQLMVALCLYCLSTGAVVSYARARAEGLGMTANVGITERADRLVAILVATGLDGLGVPYVQSVALWLLAIGSSVTIGQRALAVRRQALAEPEPAPEAP